MQNQNSASNEIAPEIIADIMTRGLYRDTAVKALLDALDITILMDGTTPNQPESLETKIPDFSTEAVTETAREVLSSIIDKIQSAATPEAAESGIQDLMKKMSGTGVEFKAFKLSKDGIEEVTPVGKSTESKESEQCTCSFCTIESISKMGVLTAETYLPLQKVFAVDILAEMLTEMLAVTEMMLSRNDLDHYNGKLDRIEKLFSAIDLVVKCNYKPFEEKQKQLFVNKNLIQLEIMQYISSL
jgi:hypothetical protein